MGRLRWAVTGGVTATAGVAVVTVVTVVAMTSVTVMTAADDISGLVRGPAGPEAGVWVIAETTDFETSYRKIVVTDDNGRFVVPDLPDASYSVWVRGYGLVDSATQQARPGANLTATVNAAATPGEAAALYPASYWYSLLEVPPESDFPGTGMRGNGIGATMRTQADWVDRMKDGCQLCHQLGNYATREFPVMDLDQFDTPVDAWEHRIQAGSSGPAMAAELNRIGRPRALTLYAEWTDRIRDGEVPPAPPRPQGRERHVVLTMWGWGHEQGMVHDEVATDKRNPTLYPNGPIYGVGGAGLVVTDPVTHRSRRLDLTANIAERPAGDSYQGSSTAIPSLYWGDERADLRSYNAHNPMMDDQGRVWITQSVREAQIPGWCQTGSDNRFAQYYPIQHRESRQVSYYDPATESFELIETCFFTHHLQFADDANDTLWLSGSTEVVGWLNTKLYDETGDHRAAQGWCPTVIDTNGDGRISKPWNEPEAAVDPSRDTRIGSLDMFQRAYGVIPHPDGSVWITRRFPVPGQLIRLDLGTNPPETCRSEVYEPPYGPGVDPDGWGYGPRGIDVDGDGIVWTALGGSGHLASFDRTKCRTLSGPTATGQHCPEGWTLHATPGPKLKGVSHSANADYHYYNWVDRFDTLGLGADTPIATGTSSDSLLALDPETGEWVVMRVPYPMGFYSRGLDGRIDDPSAGWKGRGVWAAFDTSAPWHLEGGKGATSEIVRFQIRPDPLAE
ncbi:MAG: carboxypeptidase-like regulatory domain-containing protein [Acidobacteria bacterium]|nr:carboxypeptidase-like regulatory domain-containing protein [Acidobacteriota bacterium]